MFMSPLPHTCHVSCPSHYFCVDHRMVFGESYNRRVCVYPNGLWHRRNRKNRKCAEEGAFRALIVKTLSFAVSIKAQVCLWTSGPWTFYDLLWWEIKYDRRFLRVPFLQSEWQTRSRSAYLLVLNADQYIGHVSGSEFLPVRGGGGVGGNT